MSGTPTAASTRSDRWVGAIAGLVVVALVVTASRYGFHGDELYFVEAGRHLAWGYADQGPLTPFVARLASAVDDGSLTVLRLPSAVMTGAVVVVTAATARELGAGRMGQRIAACCVGFSVFVVFTGHLLSTSTVDLLVWTAASYWAVRALRTGADRYWIIVGAVLGVGLLNKPLPAFLGAAIVVGLAVAGPRRVLARPQLWLGGALAAVLAALFLIWQLAHGLPQLTVAHNIANGGSTSSQPRWALVPFQVLLVGPPLAPIWIAGLLRLFRDNAVRELRCLGWAWIVLAVVFVATGGKPYYLGGLLPVLVAAGAGPAERWLTRGRHGLRTVLLSAAVLLNIAGTAVLALPLLPPDDAAGVVAVNPDVGETIGWPDLVATVAQVVRTLPNPSSVVLLTSSYAEAGALDRFGGRYGLPQAYSGHNAFGYWGPPNAAADRPVVVVDYSIADADHYLLGCRLAATIDNSAGLVNDETSDTVLVCAGVRGSWAAQWPHIRHLG
jgi:4-amino-4-deoxy-L-arabinose transferase-like glycosyltransferase